MSTIHIDPLGSGEELRGFLYAGDLIVLTQLKSVQLLVEHARSSLLETFAPHDPQHVHEVLTPEELSAILAVWKPAFIHNETSKALTRAITSEAGFGADRTHYDVPKPRTAYPVGHLTTGIAFAFPWHRDTWYAAPQQQINWWLPIWEPKSNNAMAFDLPSFARAVPNDSDTFDYYQSNKERLSTAQHTKSDPRSRPGARDWEPAGDTILLPRPGEIIVFSGSQLHKTIPNTSGLSRYSIDFRTVDRLDVESGLGAPAKDVECAGTALRDFLCVADGSRISESIVQMVERTPPPADAILVFDSDLAKQSANLSKEKT